MSKFKLGQPVYVTTRFRYSGEATIVKVGRKYALTDRTGDVRFDLETGYEAGSKYGNGAKIWALEAWEAKEKLRVLLDQLREAGLDVRSGASFTTTQLASILAAATEATE